MKLSTISPIVAALWSITALAKSGPKTIAYIEVNNNALSNVGRYTLDDGSPVFDVAIIFAANINYNGRKAVLYNNDNVVKTLNDAQNQIRPLQAKGIKVLLSILGNHQGVGISNFQSYAAAQDFASQVANCVNTYGLDGVDLDDEYADYGANGTPVTNQQSIAWVIQALRAALGNIKLVTFYFYGDASTYLAQSPATVGSQLNYSWNAVYSTYNAPTVPGLTKDKLSPAAIRFGSTSSALANVSATHTKLDGYGVYMTYALDRADRSAFVSAFTQPLYGQNAHFR